MHSGPIGQRRGGQSVPLGRRSTAAFETRSDLLWKGLSEHRSRGCAPSRNHETLTTRYASPGQRCMHPSPDRQSWPCGPPAGRNFTGIASKENHLAQDCPCALPEKIPPPPPNLARSRPPYAWAVEVAATEPSDRRPTPPTIVRVHATEADMWNAKLEQVRSKAC